MFRQYSFSFPIATISASYFVQAGNLGIIFDASLSYIPHLNHQEILVSSNPQNKTQLIALLTSGDKALRHSS